MEGSRFRRKIARFAFWAILIYTAFSTTIVWGIQLGFISVPSRSFVVAGQKESPVVAIPSLSETAFAEQFVREYLFWTQGREDSRAERLKPFWKPKMDVQGGLDFKESNWNSYVRNVNVWEINERKDDSKIKDITVYAETVLTSVSNPKEEKRVDRYLIVSIKKAGSSYIVVDTPHFIAAPVATINNTDESTDQKGETIDLNTSDQVEKFLVTFWKVYTTGEPQEIGYLKKGNQPTPGLTRLMKFIDMKNLSVYKNGSEYRAECDVNLEDLASGARLTYHYTLYLVQDGDRWYIVRMGQGEE